MPSCCSFRRASRRSEILSLVEPGSVERLLRARLEGSGFFGARFRESAGRALLLPRASARKRTPLWLTRQRAKSLFAAVARYDDFPLLLEAWRTCLRDEFDLAQLAHGPGRAGRGRHPRQRGLHPAPSPFCGELVWKQTNTLMYADDTPQGACLHEPARRTSCGSSPCPRTCGRGSPPAIMPAFQEKLQRTAHGYAPRDSRELLDWVKERVVLPAAEWEALLRRLRTETRDCPRAELLEPLQEKIVEHRFGMNESACIVAAESLPRLRRGIDGTDEELLAGIISEWLRFYGPIEPPFLARTFGLSAERLESVLSDLAEEEQVVLDRLAADSDALLLCDRENLEILLRISRARARPAVSTLPVERLPLFIARHQGLVRSRLIAGRHEGPVGEALRLSPPGAPVGGGSASRAPGRLHDALAGRTARRKRAALAGVRQAPAHILFRAGRRAVRGP